MADLPTNLKDDILDSSVNTRRKYRMIENEDGTYSFEDVTEYNQVGDEYGAGLINETNRQVNERVEKAVVVRDLETIGAITQPGFIPDALALKDVNNRFGGLRFGTDGEGNYGYFGADDSLIPFKSAEFITALLKGQTYETKKDCIIVGSASSTSSGAGAINLATVSVSGGELTNLYKKSFASSDDAHYYGVVLWSLKTNGETVTITCGTGIYAQAIIIG